MALAARKLGLPAHVSFADLAATWGDKALSFKCGGTEVSVANADGVTDAWGLTASGILVPAKLPAFVGASAGAGGTKGAVPAPSAGQQWNPLRGAGDFSSTELKLTRVLTSTGAALVVFEEFGDGLNYLVLSATESTTQRTRVTARGADSHVEIVAEPKGVSRVSRLGDPFPQTIIPFRAITAAPNSAEFTRHGLNAPTVNSPGSAPAALPSADGNYVQLTYDDAGDAPAGLVIPNVARRLDAPQAYAVLRSALTQSRFWCGLFTGDPSGSDTLGTIKGVGLLFNADVHTNLQFVTSDGTSQTTTDTGIAPPPNEIMCLRVRHLSGTNFDWGYYNFSLTTWQGFHVNSTNVPGTDDWLNGYLRLRSVSSTTNRAIAIKSFALYGE